MDKITYLLGAGASKEALPIVRELPGHLSKFYDEMKQDKFRLSENSQFTKLKLNKSKGQIQREFYESIIWLIKEVEHHSSVDTFAKKLYTNRDHVSLLRLKAVLSFYFIYSQIKVPTDKRYDHFIASIVDTEKAIYNLPPSVKVLTWNYDFQFEKAYLEFMNKNSLKEAYSYLNLCPSEFGFMNTDKFSLLKLNGTTGFFSMNNSQYSNPIDNLNCLPDLDLIEKLVEFYAAIINYSNAYRSMLYFAWENDPVSNTTLNKAISQIEDTTVLVIIGYSFPPFNRLIDKKIIGSLSKLKKIYFQYPDNDIKSMIEHYKITGFNHDKVSIIPYSNVSQFFIPPELL